MAADFPSALSGVGRARSEEALRAICGAEVSRVVSLATKLCWDVI